MHMFSADFGAEDVVKLFCLHETLCGAVRASLDQRCIDGGLNRQTNRQIDKQQTDYIFRDRLSLVKLDWKDYRLDRLDRLLSTCPKLLTTVEFL